jgi:hypothetical protein
MRISRTETIFNQNQIFANHIIGTCERKRQKSFLRSVLFRILTRESGSEAIEVTGRGGGVETYNEGFRNFFTRKG